MYTHDDTLQLLKHMRDNLSLSSCSLDIGVMENASMRGELRDLADAYCPSPQKRERRLLPNEAYDYEDDETDDPEKYNLGHYVLKEDPPT